MVQDHHKIKITLKRVLAGEKGSKCLSLSAFTGGVYPEDGIVITAGTGVVTQSCYLPNSDLQAVLILKPGEIMTAKSWDTTPIPPKK